MAVRRTGSPTAFWDGTTAFNQVTNPGGGLTVGVGGTSKPVMLPRGVESCAVFVTTSAATTITIEVAHHGASTAEGNEPSQASPPVTFGPLFYINTAVTLVFAGAGSAAIIIPDYEPAWMRLKTSAAANITAGFEATGD